MNHIKATTNQPSSIIFAIILCLFINTTSYSQAFDDGANVVSLGFGFPTSKRINDKFNFYKNFYDYKLSNYGTGIFKYEHGLHKYFGLGLNLEYSASRLTYKYGDVATPKDYKYNVEIQNKIVGAFIRFNGHIPIKDKLDIYGGIGLGYLYRIESFVDTNPLIVADINRTTKILDFDYQLTLGIRYMIKDHIGLFAEIGRATTLFQLGLAFKF